MKFSSRDRAYLMIEGSLATMIESRGTNIGVAANRWEEFLADEIREARAIDVCASVLVARKKDLVEVDIYRCRKHRGEK
jgi:hypothetical protein